MELPLQHLITGMHQQRLWPVKAGKHVYVEKPCCHNPAEGEILVKAAEKYKKLIQMGSQRRSFPVCRKQCRLCTKV
jgi:hypothetical protein